jgi:hypothetical protein
MLKIAEYYDKLAVRAAIRAACLLPLTPTQQAGPTDY